MNRNREVAEIIFESVFPKWQGVEMIFPFEFKRHKEETRIYIRIKKESFIALLEKEIEAQTSSMKPLA